MSRLLTLLARNDPPSALFFARDGYAQPTWPNGSPSGFYDSVDDRLWLAWEGSGVGPVRRANVTTRHMGTGKRTPIAVAGGIPSAADYHGIPHMCMYPESSAAAGHVLVVGGSHDNPLKAWVTTVPRDPFAWRPLADPVSDCSYPQPRVVTVGVTEQIFISFRGDVGADDGLGRYVVSTAIAADGTITWGTPISFANPEGGRIYQGNCRVNPSDPTEVFLIWCKAIDEANTRREHVYLAILDLDTGDLLNWDRSVTTAAASLPINVATMNASYRVITTVANGTTALPALNFDSDGKAVIGYGDGVEPNNTIKFARHATGLDFTSVNVESVNSNFPGCTPMALPAGEFDLFYPVSGNMTKRRVSAASVVGSAETVWEKPRTFPILTPGWIAPSHTDAKIMTAERANDVANDVIGDLEARVIGEAGFLRFPTYVHSPWVNAEAQAYNDRRITPFTGDDAYRIDKAFSALKAIGLAKFDAVYIPGFNNLDDADALLNLISVNFPLTKNGGLSFVAGDGFQGDGTSGWLDTGFNPSTAGGAFQQNSASFMAYVLNATANNNSAIGASANLFMFPSDGTNFTARMNATAAASAANTTKTGFFQADRSASNAQQIRKDGVEVGTSSNTSAALPNATVKCLSNTGSSNFSDQKLFLAGIGSSLTTAQVAAIYYGVVLPLRRARTFL
jgi:hypothetical protein